jgi:hypothetical protein
MTSSAPTNEPFPAVFVRQRVPSWPPPGYLSLIDAIDRLGATLFPVEWNGTEPWARTLAWRKRDVELRLRKHRTPSSPPAHEARAKLQPSGSLNHAKLKDRPFAVQTGEDEAQRRRDSAFDHLRRRFYERSIDSFIFDEASGRMIQVPPEEWAASGALEVLETGRMSVIRPGDPLTPWSRPFEGWVLVTEATLAAHVAAIQSAAHGTGADEPPPGGRLPDESIADRNERWKEAAVAKLREAIKASAKVHLKEICAEIAAAEEVPTEAGTVQKAIGSLRLLKILANKPLKATRA